MKIGMSAVKYEGWRCQRCGAPIGYLGRFFQWMLPGWLAPHSPHDCRKRLNYLARRGGGY